MSTELKREAAGRVRCSEIVSLCGVVMSKYAERKMIAIWKDAKWGHQDVNLLLRAFQVGLEEGRAAQANGKPSDPATLHE